MVTVITKWDQYDHTFNGPSVFIEKEFTEEPKIHLGMPFSIMGMEGEVVGIAKKKNFFRKKKHVYCLEIGRLKAKKSLKEGEKVGRRRKIRGNA